MNQPNKDIGSQLGAIAGEWWRTIWGVLGFCVLAVVILAWGLFSEEDALIKIIVLILIGLFVIKVIMIITNAYSKFSKVQESFINPQDEE